MIAVLLNTAKLHTTSRRLSPWEPPRPVTAGGLVGSSPWVSKTGRSRLSLTHLRDTLPVCSRARKGARESVMRTCGLRAQGQGMVNVLLQPTEQTRSRGRKAAGS